MSNGQHLDGEYAFDKILEALLEATKKNSLEEGALEEARAQARIAVLAMSNAERSLKELQQKNAAALPILAELWAATEALTISADLTGLSVEDVKMAQRVRQALQNAAIHCDQIPF